MNISVVIPLFNVSRYVHECIDALFCQDYPQEKYEILMIDNNSNDGTIHIVKKYSRIRLLFESRQGAYCARNRGIFEAGGNLVAFTDPDCRPASDWLSRIVDSMSQPGKCIVLGKRDFAFRTKSLSMLAAYESLKAKYVFSSGNKEIYYGYTNNMAVRKTLFAQLGGFMEVERGADTVFIRKAVETWGCDIVQYAHDACIRHLEIRNLMNYYGKKLLYGKSNALNQRYGSARPLNGSERLNLFFRTIRKQKYSTIQSYRLFVLLFLGMCYYEFGRRVAGKRRGLL